MGKTRIYKLAKELGLNNKVLIERLAEKYNFQVEGHKLEVFGYCQKCKAHV